MKNSLENSPKKKTSDFLKVFTPSVKSEIQSVKQSCVDHLRTELLRSLRTELLLLEWKPRITWTRFWTRIRQSQRWSLFLRCQCRFSTVPPTKISLPNVDSCIFYDQFRYTGPLAPKNARTRTDQWGFSDKIMLLLADSFLREIFAFPHHFLFTI